MAQYGLSHYSKNLSESLPKRKVLEDGNFLSAKWQVPKGAYIKRYYENAKSTHVLEFNSHGEISKEFRLKSYPVNLTFVSDSFGISLRLKQGTDLVFNIDVRLLSRNSSLTLFVEDRDRSQIFPITYLCSSILIEAHNSSKCVIINFILRSFLKIRFLLCKPGSSYSTNYGMGSCQNWIQLTRDLHIDLIKGHVLSGR